MLIFIVNQTDHETVQKNRPIEKARAQSCCTNQDAFCVYEITKRKLICISGIRSSSLDAPEL